MMVQRGATGRRGTRRAGQSARQEARRDARCGGRCERLLARHQSIPLGAQAHALIPLDAQTEERRLMRTGPIARLQAHSACILERDYPVERFLSFWGEWGGTVCDSALQPSALILQRSELVVRCGHALLGRDFLGLCSGHRLRGDVRRALQLHQERRAVRIELRRRRHPPPARIDQCRRPCAQRGDERALRGHKILPSLSLSPLRGATYERVYTVEVFLQPRSLPSLRGHRWRSPRPRFFPALLQYASSAATVGQVLGKSRIDSYGAKDPNCALFNFGCHLSVVQPFRRAFQALPW